MPTPFSHIVLAEKMLSSPDLTDEQQALLQESRPAFLLGNTAPDMGSLTDRARHETHFFRVPILRKKPAHLRLLEVHPELAVPDSLTRAQAAFVAGYLAHLWLDQAWILQVFQPYFALPQLSGSFQERLVDHNLLRAEIDRRQREELPANLDSLLRRAEPSGWLPFASDETIRAWRDHLADQVDPGGRIHTVQVFADRLDIPVDSFTSQLNSKEKMQETYSRLPPNHLESFFDLALTYSSELVSYYLMGQASDAPKSSRPPQQLKVGSVDGETAP